MSETNEQMYEITVAGDVIHGPKNNVTRAPFEKKFTLPLQGTEALSEIQNKLITNVLKKEFKDFKSVRTCALISQKPVSGKVEKLKASMIPKMTLQELIQYSAENQLKINLSDMVSTEEARKALTVHLDDLKMQAKVDKQNLAKKATKKRATKDDEFNDEV